MALHPRPGGGVGDEGIDDGLQAAQWRTAGATPETVGSGKAAGIDAAEAVRWHEFGFSLEEATEHKKKGLNPDGAFAVAAAGPASSTW